MKFLKAAIATSLMIGIAPIAQADTLYGLYADANYWQTDATVNDDSDRYESDGSVMLSAILEHGVPIIPNARVKYTDLNSRTEMMGSDFDFEATSTDLIAYYEVLDNVVSVDIGLGAKILEGALERGGDGGGPPNQWSKTSDLGQTLPMAYASVGAKLPFTGLSAKAELGMAKGTDAEATDAQAELQYNFIENMAVDVGAKIGYRIMTINYNSVDNEKLDAEFKGPYVGMEFHF